MNRRILDILLIATFVATAGALLLYSWSTSCLCGGLIGGPTPREFVTLNASRVNSPTNLTLYLRNAGNVSFTLATYYVSDLSGNEYYRPNWTVGPNPQTGSTAPNAEDIALVLIGATCGTSCTNTGQAFTFIPGHSYEITIVTLRQEFAYQVTL